MNIRLMKKIDALLGRAVAAVLPPPRRRGAPGQVRSVLLIRPGGIGDAVLLAPTVAALRAAFPDVAVDILAEARNAAVFLLCPGVRAVHLYHRPSGLIRALRNRYDVVIDSEQWHRLSAVVARLTAAPVIIGFDTNERRRLFTHTVPYRHDRYEAESFLDLLAPLGICGAFDPRRPFLAVPPEADRRAESLLPSRGRVAVLFPGASIPERRWGVLKFAELACRLAACGLLPVVVGGPDDAADGEAVAGKAGGISLAGKISLAESAAVIGRSALLVGGDSGVLHLAVGLGIPTVSIFGPGIEAKWGPLGDGHRVVNQRLPCSPCTLFGTTPTCPHEVKCLSGIDVEQVEAAAVALLSGENQNPANKNG